MKAKKLLHRKRIFPNGAIREMIVWQLPDISEERLHGLKYRFYYGKNGKRLIGYDNEAGKGDHKHIGDREYPYQFTTIEQLLADFDADIERVKQDDD